jgi:hypothetical protein
MRLAYLILAHQLPEQLVRLIERLRARDTTLLIHVDRKMDDAGFDHLVERVAGDPDVVLLPRRVCHWGTFSVVQATLDGINHAVRQRVPFDYLVLMSGQDYPIKTRDHMDTVFHRADGRSFVHHVALPIPDWHDGGWDRIRRWHFPPGPVNRVAERAANRLAAPRRFPRGFRPYGGAQFWCLSRRAGEYIEAFARSNSAFVRFSQHVFVPDEFFFQTALANSGLRTELINECMTFLEWDRPGAVLTTTDFDSLATTSHLFARKFDARVDGQILDLIDRRLLIPATGR